MYDLITNSEINSISTLNAMFPALLHDRLTIYSTGDLKGLRKTNDLPQQFSLLHYGKQIAKCLDFQCSLLTFP